MGEELVACFVDLVEVLGARMVVIAVADQAVLGNLELGTPGALVGHNIAARTADRALPRKLDAVPMLIAGIHQGAMAVGAHAVVRVAQPAALVHRRTNGLDDVLAHLVRTGDLSAPLHVVSPDKRIARTAVALRHIAIDNGHRHGKHGRLQALERKRLPVVHGTANGNEAGHGMRVLLYGANGKQERKLVGQEALGKAGIDRAGREVVRRNREDYALAGLQLADNRVDVILFLKDAAVIFLLQAGAHLSHLHGAALAAGAGQDVVIEQIDQLDLAAGLAHCAKGLLSQSLAVATVPTGTNRHHFKRHGRSSPEHFGHGFCPCVLRKKRTADAKRMHRPGNQGSCESLQGTSCR